MHRLFSVVLITLALMLIHSENASAQFQRLDSLIRMQQNISKRYEQNIQRKKDNLRTLTGLREQFTAVHDIYEAYSSYKFDSAYVYVQKEEVLARLLEDSVCINQSRLDKIHALSSAAVFPMAEEILKQVNRSTLTQEQKNVLARLEIELYINLAEYSEGTNFAQDYIDKLITIRREVLKHLEPNSLSYILTEAETLSDEGKDKESIKILEKELKNYSTGDRMYSILTKTIAFYYSNLGDKSRTKHYLILSAESDIEGAIRENTSMRLLSSMLFDEGEVKLAYSYLNFSLDDAIFFGTRLRNIQVSNLMPKILTAQYHEEKEARNTMTALLVIISIIAIVLAVAIAGIAIFHRRYRKAAAELRNAYEALYITNQEITHNHEKLKENNDLLKEREAVKEEYIGRFLALSSQFIARNDEFRKQLLRLQRDRKTEEIATILKSGTLTDEQSKIFFKNFDEAFLNIFPDFCSKVNDLLQPEAYIEIRSAGTLTTELRILALLRLGITSNDLIASILRSGLSTIYTYRSRMKARALNRENFEKKVKEIV